MLYAFTKDFWSGDIATMSFTKIQEAINFAIANNGLEVVGLVSVTTIGILIFMGAMANQLNSHYIFGYQMRWKVLLLSQL